MRLLCVICAAAMFAGCGKSSKIRSMPDAELAQKYAQCLDNAPTAPGKATACENLRKECERRREEQTSFVCRSY
ncbi:MAG: hypothetical protein P8Y45_24285 [Exilibacterium sp.]